MLICKKLGGALEKFQRQFCSTFSRSKKYAKFKPPSSRFPFPSCDLNRRILFRSHLNNSNVISSSDFREICSLPRPKNHKYVIISYYRAPRLYYSCVSMKIRTCVYEGLFNPLRIFTYQEY